MHTSQCDFARRMQSGYGARMIRSATLAVLSCTAIFALSACSGGSDADIPGDAEDDQAYAGIADDELIQLTGTESFWGGEISGELLTITTPENTGGQRLAVTRFAGRGGLSFSGEDGATSVDLTITPAPCSDGMSDRTFPFTVTLQWGEDQRMGCGWTDASPYADVANAPAE